MRAGEIGMALPASFHDLKGKSVFITGGGSGIGESLVEGFVAQGARVAFVDILDSKPLCDRLAKDYRNRPLFIPCDLTDIDALKAAVAQARAAHGGIEVLVNNAANDTRHGIDSYGPGEWDASLNINLRPHYFTAQAVAPDMKAARAGSIINFSSISWMMGLGDYPAYVAAKSGVLGLTRGLARELGTFGIRVNAVMPGWVLTERQRRLWVTPEALAAHVERQCLKQEMQPADMVCPTLFLASDASRMMTGQSLVVDGGVV